MKHKIFSFISVLILMFVVTAQTNLAPSPPVCDNNPQTDDALAINNGILYACSHENQSGYAANIHDNEPGNFILPNGPAGGYACHTNSTVTIYPWCMTFHGNGTEIWSGWPVAVSPVITISGPPNVGGINQVEDLKVETVGGVGVLLAANGVVLNRLRVNNAAIDVQLGNGAYVNTLNQPQLSNASQWCLQVPSGLQDSGEQITWNQGSCSNSVGGVQNFGAHIIQEGTSMDFLTGLYVDNEGDAQFSASHAHWETVNHAGLFIKNSGCNAFTHFTLGDDSEVFVNDSSGSAFIENDNPGPSSCTDPANNGHGAYARINDNFFYGIYPVLSGTNVNQIVMCNNSNGSAGGAMNNVPQLLVNNGC